MLNEVEDLRVVSATEGLTDDDLVELYDHPATQRPWIRANFVVSVDGAINAASGTSTGLATSLDHRVLQLLRELADVVLVGASTVRAEDYAGANTSEAGRARRAANGMAEIPPIAVVSGRADIAPDSRLLTHTSVPPIIFTTTLAPAAAKRDLAAAGAQVIELGESRIKTSALVDALTGLGLPKVVCEGGPTLTGQLVADGALDELCVTTAPILLGGNAARITFSDRYAALAVRCAHIISDSDGTQLARWIRRETPIGHPADTVDRDKLPQT
ncbi:pyrimidine reductase family protein [Nocardia brasiliensis]|uniref:pyrimidine reductase family protein n=1 Tax=Streptomyces sp. NPDC056056 TaxID=3345698 RepID=UPI0035DC14F0